MIGSGPQPSGPVLHPGPAALSANSVISNAASLFGGGLYVYYSPATLTNTVVAGNRVGANGSGSGLVVS